MGVYKKAREYLINGKVSLISISPHQILVKVDKYTVRVTKKSGMVLDSCSCSNHSRFNNLNPRCSHKLATTQFLLMEGIE